MEDVVTTIRLPKDLQEHVQKMAKMADRSFVGQLRAMIRQHKDEFEAANMKASADA